MLCIIDTEYGTTTIVEDVFWASHETGLTEMDKENSYSYSAVKIDVSEVSSSCTSKVLVLSRESTAHDVISTLLKKLKMRDHGNANFVIEAELVTSKEIAILQFEDDDKPMHAHEQFPKGSLSFFLRPKIDMDASTKSQRDGESAPKANLNGHQLTIQRIRRSLEKLKRKSSNVSIGSANSGANISDQVKKGSGGIKSRFTSQGMSTGPPPASVTLRSKPMSPTEGNHLIKADEFYKEPMREHRGRQGRSRRHHSDSQPPVSTPRSIHSPSRSENMHMLKSASTNNIGYSSSHKSTMSPYKSSTSSSSKYKTSTLPQGGTVVSMDNNDCMIFYDSSDTGSIQSMPVPISHQHYNNIPSTARAHVIPQSHHNHHQQHQLHQHHHKSDYNISLKTGVMIDKPQKSNTFRNLEDSGIDVKSPPHLNHNGHSSNMNGEVRPHSGEYEHRHRTSSGRNSISEQAKHSNNASQESNPSYLSPTVSDPSPFSLLNGMDNVKRSGSFSSLKSLPVSMYKDNNSTPNSFLFEPIEQNKLRSKSQSCTNLNSNKVVRRRSLPPLDVSQEKLEQKKTSLSKRLARKINRYRENEKRYVLPSPHSFTPESLRHYKDQVQKGKRDIDDMSLADMADMEVANILEGKPEHPTDSDVEDYLACVESTDTSRNGDTISQASHTYSEKKIKHSSSKVVHESRTHLSKESHKTVDMEKSGYHRYSNSAKLERQQKQLDQQQQQQQHKKSSSAGSHMSPYGSANVSQTSFTTNDNLSKTISPKHGQMHPNSSSNHTGHKPKKSLNKFVEQSMQSFLDHCHDVNMVNTHDPLDLHQAALHGQFPPTSPVKTNIPSPVKTKLKSNEYTGYDNKMPHDNTAIPQTAHYDGTHSMVNSQQIKSPKSFKSSDHTHHKQHSHPNDAHFVSQQTMVVSNKHSPQSPTKSKYDFATVYTRQLSEEKAVNELSHRGYVNLPASDKQQSSSQKENKYQLSVKESTNCVDSTEKLHGKSDMNSNKVQENVFIKQDPQNFDDVDGVSIIEFTHKKTEPSIVLNSPTKKDNSIIDSDSNSTTSSHTRHSKQRRSSQCSNSTVHSQSSKDKYQNNLDNDDDGHGKTLSLFTIMKSHDIFAKLMEKGSCKSYGIKVKRQVFTPSHHQHHQAWVSEPINGVIYNVVVIKEIIANSPADINGTVANGDLIIEVNGHNVLQSSDKVVGTLLDARSTLEVVIARQKQASIQATDSTNNNIQHSVNTQGTNNSQQVLTFDNMEDISYDVTNNSSHSNNDVHTFGKTIDNNGANSARSKAYETIYGEDQTSNILSQRSEEFDDISKQPTSPSGPTFLL